MNYKKSQVSEISRNEEYVYYDMVFSNIDSENYDTPNVLSFNDTHDTPLINDISQYKMSIVRFELSTWSLPVFYFRTKKNSADPNEGCYTVTMEYGAFTTPAQRVMFVPQDKSKAVPPASNTFPNGINPFNEYYYVYNFNNMVDMVNTALNNCFVALQALVGAPLATANPPFLVWNDDLTASLYCELDYFDITAVNHVKIYFNRPLYSLFNSFPSYKYEPTSTGKHYQILTNPRSGLNCITKAEYGAQVLIKIDQEFATNESWSPIDSICFTSSLPIVSSQQSNPVIFENGQQLQYSTKYNQSEPIITDFQTADFNYRSTVYYVPQAEYRWISFLNNHQPLYNIKIQCYVKDKFGILRPFYMPSNSSASLKILFKRI